MTTTLHPSYLFDENKFEEVVQLTPMILAGEYADLFNSLNRPDKGVALYDVDVGHDVNMVFAVKSQSGLNWLMDVVAKANEKFTQEGIYTFAGQRPIRLGVFWDGSGDDVAECSKNQPYWTIDLCMTCMTDSQTFADASDGVARGELLRLFEEVASSI